MVRKQDLRSPRKARPKPVLGMHEGMVSRREATFGKEFRKPEIVRTSTPDLQAARRSEDARRVQAQMAECELETRELSAVRARLQTRVDSTTPELPAEPAA